MYVNRWKPLFSPYSAKMSGSRVPGAIQTGSDGGSIFDNDEREADFLHPGKLVLEKAGRDRTSQRLLEAGPQIPPRFPHGSDAGDAKTFRTAKNRD